MTFRRLRMGAEAGPRLTGQILQAVKWLRHFTRRSGSSIVSRPVPISFQFPSVIALPPRLALALFCEACSYAHRCPVLRRMKALHSLLCSVPHVPVRLPNWANQQTTGCTDKFEFQINNNNNNKFSISKSPMSHSVCQCMSHNLLHIITFKMMDCLSGI